MNAYRTVFIFFWALFALTNHGTIVGEGGDSYKLAEHVLHEGKLGFELPPSNLFVTTPDGKSYPAHEIGSALFMIPTAFCNTAVIETILSKLAIGIPWFLAVIAIFPLLCLIAFTGFRVRSLAAQVTV